MKKLHILLAATIALSGLGACGEIPNYNLAYENARAAGLPLVITNISVSYPNSAGGVDLYFVGKNTSNKTIKYINFNVIAYNAVGDQVRGTIRGSSMRSLKKTGPIAPNQFTSTSTASWANAWYNYSIRCARVSRVKITYMDGTAKTYSSHASINQLLTPGVSNSCAVQ